MGKNPDIFLSDAIVRLTNARFKTRMETDKLERQWLHYDNGVIAGSIRITVIRTRQGQRKIVCEKDLPCPRSA